MESIFYFLKVVYIGFFVEIGIVLEIRFRRDIVDIVFDIFMCILYKFDVGILIVGSYCEGFRFLLFDMDFMVWFFVIKVISDFF